MVAGEKAKKKKKYIYVSNNLRSQTRIIFIVS